MTLSRDNKGWLIVLALTGTGILLRLYGIANESLWYDELESWNQSNRTSLLEVIEVMRGNVHPPGWNILLYFVQRVIGDSEIALRLPSAIAGIAAIPAIYVLGRYLCSMSTGLIAAALITVLWAPIYYSQEARAYSLLILLSILTLYMLLRILSSLERGQIKWLFVIAYILLCTISSYLHYSGLLIVVFQGCWAFMRVRKNGESMLAVVTIYAVLVLLYLPWLIELWADFSRDKFHLPPPSGPATVLNFFFFKQYVTVHVPIAFLVSAALIIEVRRLRRHNIDLFQSPTLLLITWLLFPYFAFYIKSVTGTPILASRYILVSAPAAYLLIGQSLTLLISNIRLRALLTLAIAAFCLWFLVFQAEYYSRNRNVQFREAAATIANANDIPITDSIILGFNHSYQFDYYFKHLNSSRRVDYKVRSNSKQPGLDKAIDHMQAFLDSQDARYIWLMRGHWRVTDKVLSTLNNQAKLVRNEKYQVSEIWLFDRQAK